MSKAERMNHANAVLRAMGSHGRRFFYNEKHARYAEFVIDEQGRLRLVDDYTGQAIALIDGDKWRGFSHGGTCRAIVEDLARYIRTGKKTRNHFGPWPDWVCDGDLWGYGDGALAVRKQLAGNPAVPELQTA